MGTEQVNGSPVQDQQQNPKNALDAALAMPTTVFINGCLVSMQSFFPMPVAMERMAFLFGQILSSGIQADLATTLRMRTAIRDAFAEGVSKGVMMQGQAMPPMANPPNQA